MRYRMTVEVQTPQGVRSGSAIREIKYDDGNGWNWLPPFMWLGEQRPRWRLRGEAVAVDLPNGKTVFALLRSETREDFGGREIWSIFEQTGRDEVELWPTAPRTNRPVVGDPKPMLVYFRDLVDPNTVEHADPEVIWESLGAGYRLHRITVSRTTEPVTTGITQRLKWLSLIRRQRGALRLDVPRYVSQSLPVHRVGTDDFSTELSK